MTGTDSSFFPSKTGVKPAAQRVALIPRGLRVPASKEETQADCHTPPSKSPQSHREQLPAPAPGRPQCFAQLHAATKPVRFHQEKPTKLLKDNVKSQSQ